MPKTLRWAPYEGWKDWLRGLVISLGGATFLAYAKAFNSGRLPVAERFAYWLGLMLLGWVWGLAISSLFFGRVTRPRHVWLRVLISALVIAIPYSVVVGFVTALVQKSTFASLADYLDILSATLLISLVMIAVNVLAMRSSGATSASSVPPKFLDRLPAKLKGADIWAVEAEDHYLRLHTSLGQDLILMRLADAIAELEGIEGAQTHRSWWVARQAITEAVRGDGRATLTLPDGVEAPVSRTHARRLRQSGWI